MEKKDSSGGLESTVAQDDPALAATTAPASGPGAPGSDYDGLVTVDAAHYAVGEEIARGGMGRILRARDRRLGRTIALKQLLAPSSGFAARFEREARITARLQHPAIVPVYEAGRLPSGEPFYAMKLVSGRRLDKVIEESSTRALRGCWTRGVWCRATEKRIYPQEGPDFEGLGPHILSSGF